MMQTLSSKQILVFIILPQQKLILKVKFSFLLKNTEYLKTSDLQSVYKFDEINFFTASQLKALLRNTFHNGKSDPPVFVTSSAYFCIIHYEPK